MWTRNTAARLHRRHLFALLAGLLPTAAGADGFSWNSLAATCLQPLHDAAKAPDGPGLLQSFRVRNGPAATDFDRVHANCAYVYDNAVAGLALLAAGETDLAARIGTALALAQSHDRLYHDGRLRNAYQAGAVTQPAKLPGWWDSTANRWLEDPYQVGSGAGPVAWAILLWVALGTAAHLDAAHRAAFWLATTLRAPAGFYGGYVGEEPEPQKLTWVSTEQNLDLAVAFAALGRNDDADHAQNFVQSMWDPGERHFFSGLTPSGASNPHSAADANLWPLLGLANPEPYAGALDWVLTRHRVADGIDFDTDRDGIWLEGTAYAALALRRAARPAEAFGATILANTDTDGMVFATSTAHLTTGLTTGLDGTAPPFLYFRRPHIAPTAWAVLAALLRDPFRM